MKKKCMKTKHPVTSVPNGFHRGKLGTFPLRIRKVWLILMRHIYKKATPPLKSSPMRTVLLTFQHNIAVSLPFPHHTACNGSSQKDAVFPGDRHQWNQSWEPVLMNNYCDNGDVISSDIYCSNIRSLQSHCPKYMTLVLLMIPHE